MSLVEWIWLGGWAIVVLVAVVLGLYLYFSDPDPDEDLGFCVFMGVVAGAFWWLIAAIGLPYLALTSLHRCLHPKTRIPSCDLRDMDRRTPC